VSPDEEAGARSACCVTASTNPSGDPAHAMGAARRDRSDHTVAAFGRLLVENAGGFSATGSFDRGPPLAAPLAESLACRPTTEGGERTSSRGGHEASAATCDDVHHGRGRNAGRSCGGMRPSDLQSIGTDTADERAGGRRRVGGMLGTDHRRARSRRAGPAQPAEPNVCIHSMSRAVGVSAAWTIGKTARGRARWTRVRSRGLPSAAPSLSTRSRWRDRRGAPSARR